MKIGLNFGQELKKNLVNCVQTHSNVFAWSHEDMSEIDLRIACHKLAISKDTRAVK